VLVVAGCQSNPEPPPLDRTSTSESPTPSPSPPVDAPPPLPDAAKGTSEASAKAFVRHYVELINFAVATGSTQAFTAVSDRNCVSCNAVADRVRNVYGAGGSIISDGWVIESIQTVPSQPTRAPKFDVGLRLSKQIVRKAADSRPETFEGGKLPATFHLVRRGDAWFILGWQRSA
jgi:hypothetical protein